jgi:hypothetical protein
LTGAFVSGFGTGGSRFDGSSSSAMRCSCQAIADGLAGRVACEMRGQGRDENPSWPLFFAGGLEPISAIPAVRKRQSCSRPGLKEWVGLGMGHSEDGTGIDGCLGH